MNKQPPSGESGWFPLAVWKDPAGKTHTTKNMKYVSQLTHKTVGIQIFSQPW